MLNSYFLLIEYLHTIIKLLWCV